MLVRVIYDAPVLHETNIIMKSNCIICLRLVRTTRPYVPVIVLNTVVLYYTLESVISCIMSWTVDSRPLPRVLYEITKVIS